MHHLISVIIPCYNYGHLVAGAIRSVLNQTYTNIEVIVVNDKSTDTTATVCSSITDSRLKIIENPINVGVDVSINRGIRASAGDYLCLLDADDTLPINSIAVRLAAFSPEILAVHGGLTRIVNGKREYITPVKVEDKQAFRQFVRRPGEYRRKGINSYTLMVHRRAIEAVGLRDETGYWQGHEDYEWALRLTSRVSCRTIDTSVYEYHVHADSKLHADAAHGQYAVKRQELATKFGG